MQELPNIFLNWKVLLHIIKVIFLKRRYVGSNAKLKSINEIQLIQVIINNIWNYVFSHIQLLIFNEDLNILLNGAVVTWHKV